MKFIYSKLYLKDRFSAERLLVRYSHLRRNDVSEHPLGSQPRVHLLATAIQQGISPPTVETVSCFSRQNKFRNYIRADYNIIEFHGIFSGEARTPSLWLEKRGGHRSEFIFFSFFIYSIVITYT